MRSIGYRLPILAALALPLVLDSGWVPANAAEVVYLETVDWVPAFSVVTVPTSYVAATSFVVPASYVIPTAYTTAYVAETAFVEPTTYLSPTYYETRLRRRGLFGRRLVETTRAYYMPTTAYYPTTHYYYYPTTYTTSAIVDRAVVPSGYVVASSACCGTEIVASSTPTVRTLPAEPSTTSVPKAKKPAVIQSKPEEEVEPISSTVSPPPAEEPRPRVESSRSAPAAGKTESPPTPPTPNREQSTAAPNKPASAQPKAATAPPNSPAGNDAQELPPVQPAPARIPGAVEPPVAPADGFDLRSADEGSAGAPIRREARKPTTYTPRPEFRNILFGNVKARTSGDPQEGVRVTLSSRTNAFEDRVQETDAAGRFAVRVPDGDWTVKVTMPSGRTYPVSQITVSNGAITDDDGRDIPSLVITR